MSAFAFALQPLLDARVRAEDECRGALAAAAEAAAAERVRTAQARDAFARAARAFRDSALGLPPPAVRGAMAELALLADCVRYGETRLLRRSDDVSAAREAFAAARRERERIEALRDRARAAFARLAERRETLALGEANDARHNSVILVAPSFHN